MLRKDLGKLPEVISTNHPISLGWSVKLCTDGKLAKSKFRSKRGYKYLCKHFERSRGMHITFPVSREVVIYINTHYHADKKLSISKSRLVELVTHEISHAVDFFFERASVKKIDTEFRAYHLDWMVGETIRCFKGFD